MSRKSQRRGHVSRMEVDSDEDAGPSSAPHRAPRASQRQSQSQRTQRIVDDDSDEAPVTQSRHKGGDLPEEEENHVMGSLIKFLLSSAESKNAIKQVDIKKYGIPSHQKHYSSLMGKAKSILNELFGYKLIQLPGQKWIIINGHDHDQIRLHPEDFPAQTLLFLVLSHIFMTGENCREESLIQFLKNLNIWREHGGRHEYFGNVEDMIMKKFIQQVYLVRSKNTEGDNEIYTFDWGARANEELDPRHVLEFVSKVFRGRPATSWTAQYRRAHKIEG